MKILLAALALVASIGGHANAQVVRPAPTNDKDQAWSNMIDYAFKKSAQDNNGVPTFKRKCFADVMQCTNAISYYNEERKVIILTYISSAAGQGIARYICIPNEFNDVQFCVNFDTRAESVNIKEGDEWKMAAGSR